MVLNENECSNALYNANHRELHVSTLMGFCSYIFHDFGNRVSLPTSRGLDKVYGTFETGW